MLLTILIVATSVAAWLLLASRHWLIPAVTLAAAAIPAGVARAALATHPRGWPFVVAGHALLALGLAVAAALGFAACAARR
jgi:hypothetical protein